MNIYCKKFSSNPVEASKLHLPRPAAGPRGSEVSLGGREQDNLVRELEPCKNP